MARSQILGSLFHKVLIIEEFSKTCLVDFFLLVCLALCLSAAFCPLLSSLYKMFNAALFEMKIIIRKDLMPQFQHCSGRSIFKNIPGPRGWPVVGCIFTLLSQRHLKIEAISKRYGGIFQMKLGRKPVVVLTDPRLMKEALSQSAFAGRPEAALENSGEYYGLVNNNGEQHKNMRRMVTKALHNLGASKNGMRRVRGEEIIHEGCLEMIKELENRLVEPVDLNRMMSACIGKILAKFMFNVDRKIDDQDMLEELKRVEEGFKVMKWFYLFKYIPFLKTIGFGRKYVKLIAGNHEKSKNYFSAILRDCKESSKDCRDTIMHPYLKAVENNILSKDEGNMKSFMAEIFSTGVETTKTTMMWAMLYMCKYPHMQQKVQDELDTIDSFPTMDDEPYLIYTQAVLKEVQRSVSVVFEGVSHMTIKDTKLAGYAIPNGTEVYFHQYTMHHDKKLWTNPDQFNPDRFITEEHTIDSRTNIFSPFSSGYRVCPGKRLAEMNLFLMFSMLLKSFKFTFEAGQEPSTEPNIGITLTPKNFRVCIESRTVTAPHRQ